MLKALCMKEAYRFWSSISSSKKASKEKKYSKGTGSKILFLALWIFVFFSLAMAFMGMAALLGDAILPTGLDWLYYSMIGMAGLLLSIIGNGFIACNSIFKPKDNDLLLSMPIPSNYIIISRILLIFMLSVVYTIIYVIPSLINHSFDYATPISSVISCIVLVFVNALIVTALSALIGWVIALISNNIKNKSAATVVFTIAFLGVYYYFYFNVNKYLNAFAAQSGAIGDALKSNALLWPIYHYGLAAAGDLKSLLMYTLFALVLIVITYLVLNRNFIKIATTTEKKVDYKYSAEKQSQVQLQSPRKALLAKEFAKFTSSPVYMINCGLGILMLIGASVALFIKAETIRTVLEMATVMAPEIGEVTGLIVLAIMIFSLSTIDTAAPSISLEGKSLWILQSLPVNAADVFYAKKRMQLLLSAVPGLILLASSCIVVRLDWQTAVFIGLASYVYVELHSSFSLFLNIKMPKLDWTNEAVPVKQSLAVVIAMFGGWILVGIIALVYWFLLKGKVETQGVIAGCLVAFAVLGRLMNQWLFSKGVKEFEAL